MFHTIFYVTNLQFLDFSIFSQSDLLFPNFKLVEMFRLFYLPQNSKQFWVFQFRDNKRNGKVNGKVRITTQRPKAPPLKNPNHINILFISPIPIPIMNNEQPKNFVIVEIE